MPFIWLRVAMVLYGVGLVHAILMLRQRGERSGKIAVPAVTLGMVFHFVSLVETATLYGYTELLTIRHAESVLALLIAIVFIFMYLRYHTASPSAFVLTFASTIAQHHVSFPSPTFRSGWILFHVSTLLVGYAMLFLSFVSSLLYLVLSRQIKHKKTSNWAAHMPSLQEVDDLGYRSLVLGFPFMTVGLLAGAVVAQEHYGASFLADPKVLLSLLMWAIYMVLLYTRWSAGLRGAKAAYLASFAFAVAVCAWGANYMSRLHRFIAP
jgi:ABC-type uncharacterized transport system permease subunit